MLAVNVELHSAEKVICWLNLSRHFERVRVCASVYVSFHMDWMGVNFIGIWRLHCTPLTDLHFIHFIARLFMFTSYVLYPLSQIRFQSRDFPTFCWISLVAPSRLERFSARSYIKIGNSKALRSRQTTTSAFVSVNWTVCRCLSSMCCATNFSRWLRHLTVISHKNCCINKIRSTAAIGIGDQ